MIEVWVGRRTRLVQSLRTLSLPEEVTPPSSGTINKIP